MQSHVTTQHFKMYTGKQVLRTRLEVCQCWDSCSDDFFDQLNAHEECALQFRCQRSVVIVDYLIRAGVMFVELD